MRKKRKLFKKHSMRPIIYKGAPGEFSVVKRFLFSKYIMKIMKIHRVSYSHITCTVDLF